MRIAVCRARAQRLRALLAATSTLLFLTHLEKAGKPMAAARMMIVNAISSSIMVKPRQFDDGRFMVCSILGVPGSEAEDLRSTLNKAR